MTFDDQAAQAAPAGVISRAMANCAVDMGIPLDDEPRLIQALTTAGFSAAEITAHLATAREAALVLKGLRS